MTADLQLDWEEYEACEAECCPVCGSFSPSHIPEDGDGPCREVPPLSQYLNGR